MATNLGLKVLAVTYDQGTNNYSLYTQMLGVSRDKPFTHNSNVVYALYDSPHLIKSVRSILAKNDIQTDDGTVGKQ